MIQCGLLSTAMYRKYHSSKSTYASDCISARSCSLGLIDDVELSDDTNLDLLFFGRTFSSPQHILFQIFQWLNVNKVKSCSNEFYKIQTAPVVSGDLSHFYWLSAVKVSIVLTSGAASGVKCLPILKSGKKRLRFCATGPSLNELIGYENLMDCPEIRPEDSLGIKHKNRVGDLRFSKWIFRNGLRRNTCCCIFGHQT